MTRLVRILLILVLFPALLSVVAGWMGAPGFLHPEKRVFTADMVRDADVTFAQIGARREDFDVRAPDGVTLRGWKVRTAKPNGAWVLVFHGVADNRYGTEEHARMLLQRGYGVVMMDSRAHGASGGEMASYGWLERKDVSAAIDWEQGLRCRRREAMRESKRLRRKLRLRTCRKRRMTTRDCNVGRCWERHFSRRERGC